MPLIVYSLSGEAWGKTTIVKVNTDQESEYVEPFVQGIYTVPQRTIKSSTVVSRDAALLILAEAIKVHEGWYPGSVAWDNLNPGNLRSWPTAIGTNRGFAVFPDYETGWTALLDLLRKRCALNPTLYQLMSWYAPASDNNDPYRYASLLAQKLGVTINTRISDIYC